jgi:carnitine O-palmitoyltransferase 2
MLSNKTLLCSTKKWSYSICLPRGTLPAVSGALSSFRSASSGGSGNNETYQYLPRSVLPTYYFQKSLPRLPIPKLELTVSRYLESLKPIVPEEQLAKTQKLTLQFQDGIGRREFNIKYACSKYCIYFTYQEWCDLMGISDFVLELHNDLVAQDKVLKQTSYISAPWFEMYLRDRNPLPINTNPALVFVEDDTVMIKLPKSRWQLARTTNLLVSSLRF